MLEGQSYFFQHFYFWMLIFCLALMGVLWFKRRFSVMGVTRRAPWESELYLSMVLIMVIDLSWVLTELLHVQVGFLSFLLNVTWHLFFISAALFWFALCNGHMPVWRLRGRVPFVLFCLPAVAAMLLTLSTRLVVDVSPQGCYVRGPLYWLSYVVMTAYNLVAMGLAFANAYRCRDRLERNFCLSLAMVSVPYLCGIAMQVAYCFDMSYIGAIVALAIYDLDSQRRLMSMDRLELAQRESDRERMRLEELASLQAERLRQASHAKLRADALSYIVDSEASAEEFMSFFAQRILELTACDQVILRRTNGTRFVANAPGIEDVSQEVCRACPFSHPEHEVYASCRGRVEMPDTAQGFNGVYPHGQCPARSSFMRTVYVDGRLEGLFSVHYLRQAFDLTDAGRDTIDTFTQILSLALARIASRQREKAAQQAKATFLATMSHEIRTPLNAVIGFTEFLQDPDLTAEARASYLSGIVQSSQALLALINDILDLSKIDAGKMALKGGACDFHRLFGEMEQIFRFKADQKTLKMAWRVAPSVPVVCLREERMRQVLLNLVGNAVKFTERGSVTVTADWPSEGCLVLTVADTGTGISVAAQRTIFDPFEQDGAVRGGKVYQGTGLGLPIVKRLVESVGGTLTVESRLGAGSTFTVTIPDTERAASVPLPSLSGGQASVLEHVSRVRCVVLVDDVPINLMVARKHVLRAGVPEAYIHQFSGVPEALAYLNALCVDVPTVVLTDLWMPGMTGVDLVQSVRRNPALSSVRVVAVTADADSGGSFDMSAFDAIATKPLTTDKIRQLL